MTHHTLPSQLTTDPTQSVIPGSVPLERLDTRDRRLLSLPMFDDGTHGDAVARDGSFTLRGLFWSPLPTIVCLWVIATFRMRPR